MKLCIVIFLVSGIVHGGEADIFSSLKDWLATRYACASTCPLYLKHVCGFDPRLGYMLADNECLMIQHNLCYKTNYIIKQDEVCEGLMNATLNQQPPLVILSQAYL